MIPHVIVDVGGQDIKLIVLKNGRVKDFKLNTQCSAGNGYFLQSTAEGFGLKVEQYRGPGILGQVHAGVRVRLRGVHAVGHRELPAPGLARGGDPGGPGGGAAEERVPVRGEHSESGGARIALRAAGRHAEQHGRGEGGGGFHPVSFRAAGSKPEIIVHEHCGESGAIGAAVEAGRLYRNGKATTFIGLDAVRNIHLPHHTQRRHALLFLQEQLPAHLHRRQHGRLGHVRSSEVCQAKVPLHAGEQRLIIATCEKGTVEDMNDMKEIKAGLDEKKNATRTSSIWRRMKCSGHAIRRVVADPIPTRAWTKIDARTDRR